MNESSNSPHGGKRLSALNARVRMSKPRQCKTTRVPTSRIKWISSDSSDELDEVPNPNDKILVSKLLPSSILSSPNSNINTPSVNEIVAKSHQQHVLEKMYKDSLFTDIIFTAQTEQEFQAHKAVVSAQSPILCEMLMHSKSSNLKIELKDFAPETIEEMLKFMYSGQVYDRGEESITELLKIAMKYAINPLHIKCQNILLKYLTIQNAIELLKLSDINASYQLQEGVLEFISQNIHKFSKEQLLGLNSNTLYSEILIRVAKKHQKI